MIYCPNINLEGWKKMESRLGDSAYYYYYLNDGEYLTDQQIDSILNNETKINKPNVVFEFKGVHLLIKNLDIAKSLWKKIPNKKEFWDKIQNKLQIPKDQIELLKITEGNSLEEIILNFASNYSYTIEINTAKNEPYNWDQRIYYQPQTEKFNNKITTVGYDVVNEITGKKEFFLNEEDAQNRVKELQVTPTQYYANLTAPGGTNHTENEIATPAITPSIKGHAQFATNNGIGWCRSDDKHPFTGFLEDLISSGTIKKVPCG